MKRGLTLIELLMALSLLSMLMIAVASWVQTTARTTVEFAEPLQWNSAAEAVMQLIHDDLTLGDFELSSKMQRPAKAARIRVDEEELSIKTRDRGEIVHAYGRDAHTGELSLFSTDQQNRTIKRLLLGQVSRFECTHNEDKDVLTVAIESEAGRLVSRSYPL